MISYPSTDASYGTTRLCFSTVARTASLTLAFIIAAALAAWACDLLGDAVSLTQGSLPNNGGTQVTLTWDDPYSSSATDVYAYGYNSSGQLSWAPSPVYQGTAGAGMGGQSFVIPSGVNVAGGIVVTGYQHTGKGVLQAQGSAAPGTSCTGGAGGD